MKNFAKTVAAIALTLTATACDPMQYVPGRSDGSNAAVPCNPNQGGTNFTNASTDTDDDGPSLNASAPIVDPHHNDQF